MSAYDLLIIGAGPAGSAAATFARQAGLCTLVVEKETFPRFRIGESLLPHGNALLREMGVWPRVAAAGFTEKYGAFFRSGSGTATREILFDRGLVPGLEMTYQVDRAHFDTLLLEHARELGAEVRLATTVRSVDSSADSHTATLESADGSRETVQVRWIIDSGGRDNLYPSQLKRDLLPPFAPRRVAIYTHVRGASRPAGRAAGHTTVVRLDEGWFWLIPIDAERTSVGLVTLSETLRAHSGSPADLFRQKISESPTLRSLLDRAVPVMDFHVTADYAYFRRQLAAPRLVLTGDAAGFFDPIFSSGVYLALHSAREAVRLIARAHAAGRVLTPREIDRYTRHVKTHAGVFQRLIRMFYDNDAFSVFMCPRPPLGLDRGINSIVAGHARLVWPIRWRFYLFLLVCRLQRRLPLVPRIAL